ncbi:unnamed protein product [Dimorphilus gyrociliatus]|uniref:Palmitoyltransferase n=1 Tax=Dimorphilus gyrociliatus TaxID=2664684 RepID=A0A7I8V7Y9_9ANNE|nr:unnamed protein product [Dimorphilus gyrociliatus]
MTNPGKVPDSQFYEPESKLIEHSSISIEVPTQPKTYCDKCQKRRPDRAHHCKRCKQCVLKMDHHCPWINNCVGEANQGRDLYKKLVAK